MDATTKIGGIIDHSGGIKVMAFKNNETINVIKDAIIREDDDDLSFVIIIIRENTAKSIIPPIR